MAQELGIKEISANSEFLQVDKKCFNPFKCTSTFSGFKAKTNIIFAVLKKIFFVYDLDGHYCIVNNHVG